MGHGQVILVQPRPVHAFEPHVALPEPERREESALLPRRQHVTIHQLFKRCAPKPTAHHVSHHARLQDQTRAAGAGHKRMRTGPWATRRKRCGRQVPSSARLPPFIDRRSMRTGCARQRGPRPW